MFCERKLALEEEDQVQLDCELRCSYTNGLFSCTKQYSLKCCFRLAALVVRSRGEVTDVHTPRSLQTPIPAQKSTARHFIEAPKQARRKK